MTRRKMREAELRQRVGARVYFLRTSRGMTALHLAEQSGLHRNTIYRIEAGLSLCSLGQIWRIAEVFGVAIEEFLSVSPSMVHFSITSTKSS